ncbi:predicted protein [Sclerotinia sclerotiorum 1980 UF-70]|uniref:Uncharacterized protein n=1 Tax=Sclerotinia sclerotiorum (strain ATCC 18683 / 1980 / Ss-1) TaxID=665079 RepID=A7E5B3_SCLS1|nr:predicted protein [Sclerotinia sclerotiorum 1980 UF-70]EDN91085.1 predicted protein [Sclerotinia sclerotiorum 1980 UF-70]
MDLEFNAKELMGYSDYALSLYGQVSNDSEESLVFCSTSAARIILQDHCIAMRKAFLVFTTANLHGSSAIYLLHRQ